MDELSTGGVMERVTDSPVVLMESTPVSRELGISITWLHQLAAQLDPPVLRTTSGRRLFLPEDVAALKRMRE